MERIIRKAGAERVSKDAVEELRKALEAAGEDIAKEASKFSDHADRSTVTEEDVDIATR